MINLTKQVVQVVQRDYIGAGFNVWVRNLIETGYRKISPL